MWRIFVNFALPYVVVDAAVISGEPAGSRDYPQIVSAYIIGPHPANNVNAGVADFGQVQPRRRRSMSGYVAEPKIEDGRKL